MSANLSQPTRPLCPVREKKNSPTPARLVPNTSPTKPLTNTYIHTYIHTSTSTIAAPTLAITTFFSYSRKKTSS